MWCLDRTGLARDYGTRCSGNWVRVSTVSRWPGPQVLEDVCLQQEFSPGEYDLRFQRNVLDLSVQWRYANLPNHAKLEMVPVSRSRDASESVVRVALQLEDGSRLQDTFSAAQTLWELLCHFPQTRERLEQPCGAKPICVHMRDEVAGRAALQHRTLRSLGLTGGQCCYQVCHEVL